MNSKKEEAASRVDTLAALIIGYVLTYPFNSYVQNAIGNWFMLLGQVLETNATFLQLYQSNNNTNNQINKQSHYYNRLNISTTPYQNKWPNSNLWQRI